MEIKKSVPLILLLFFFGQVFAQDAGYVVKGTLSTRLTLSPSYMFTGQQSYFYLHGSAGYYLSNHISADGEIYFYTGKLSPGISIYSYNHSLFFGASKHFIKGNHDLFLGIQPGISLTKLNAAALNISSTKAGIDPLFSVVGGYNFYVNRFFHFFFMGRYVIGEHTYDVHEDLSDVRISAGLGFNLNLLKIK